jgi:drug/metabolite transporter (DMT)-like permease
MTSIPSQQSSRKIFLIGLAIAITGSILFSTKGIVVKLIYRYPVDAVTLIGFRMMFSLPFFAAVAIWQARISKPLAGGDRWRIIFMGLLGYYLSSFLGFIGLQYIGVGLERLLMFLTPSFVLLLSIVYFKKKIVRHEWIALGISYAGIFLVFIHDANIGGPNVLLGSLFVIGSALTYALYLLMSGELVARVGAIRLVAYAMTVSSIACIAQFFLLRPVNTLVQPFPVYGLSVFNAVVSTVLPVFVTMIAVARIGPAMTSQAGMIGPISTLFMGAVMLDEPVTAIHLAGTALVLCGIYLLSKKKT